MHCFSPIVLKTSGFQAFKITSQFHKGQVCSVLTCCAVHQNWIPGIFAPVHLKSIQEALIKIIIGPWQITKA
jgi:hypothetical protein